MKFSPKFFPIFLFLLFAACATHNNFVTDHKDAWFNDSDMGLVFCRANIKTDGSADPTCFETGFHKFTNEAKSLKK